jgi:hypothetical protein
MVTIPPYHPMIIDHTSQVGIAQQQENTSQVGIAQQQEKQAEEKKVTVQNTQESDRIHFEKEKKEEERRKKRREAQQEEEQHTDDEGLEVSKKRLLDIIV